MIEKKEKELKNVIAITKDENSLKAACLSMKGDNVEVVWTKQSEPGQESWQAFAEQCGLKQSKSKVPVINGNIVVGFDSIGVVFYHFDVPATKAEDIDKIVRLQTEVKLPLPPDQIQLSYKKFSSQDGHTPVIVAAARRQSLQNFVNTVKAYGPSKIVLDYEAVVKTWSKFFGQSQNNALIISMGRSSTKICQVEFGTLCNAAVIGIGFEDFRIDAGSVSAIAGQIFVQDFKNVLDLFGIKSNSDIPVYFFSCGEVEDTELKYKSELVKTLVSVMTENGLNVKVADLCHSSSSRMTAKDVTEFYDYRMPIGLALTAMDQDQTLGLFDTIYNPAGEEQKKPLLSSIKVALVIVEAMVLIGAFFFYLLDVATAKKLDAMKEKMNFDTLVEQQKLTETIAAIRPDILELLSVLNSNDSSGGGGRGRGGMGGAVVLDSFDFKKGQPVKITGTVQTAEQLYQFQETLAAKKDFKNVKIQSAPQDARTQRLKFTITFDYKDWTSKKN